MTAASRWRAEDLEPVPRCPVCGGAPAGVLRADLINRLDPGDPKRWRMVRCGACTAAWLDPRPRGPAIAAAYRGAYHTHGPPAPPRWVGPGRGAALRARLLNGYLARRYGYRLRPAARRTGPLLALVPGGAGRARSLVRDLPAPAPGDRLLDLGCGNGQFLLQMRELGWEGEGIEPDPDAAAHARAAGFPVGEGPLTEATFPPARFAAITLGHVIEHLPDPIATLRACRGALRPGGRIWIATPNVDSGVRRTLGARWFGFEAPRHLVMFTRTALRRALADAGFGDHREGPPIPVAGAWVYPISLSDLPTLGAGPLPRLPMRHRLAAAGLDLAAAAHRGVAEEIVITARAGP